MLVKHYELITGGRRTGGYVAVIRLTGLSLIELTEGTKIHQKLYKFLLDLKLSLPGADL